MEFVCLRTFIACSCEEYMLNKKNYKYVILSQSVRQAAVFLLQFYLYNMEVPIFSIKIDYYLFELYIYSSCAEANSSSNKREYSWCLECSNSSRM